LRRAIGNLLDNAVKYVHQRFGNSSGGRGSIALSDEGNNWTLRVRDNGVGIPPGVADKIFERFQRGEASRSRFGKGGYGLGLSIAKRIIEAHNGDIFLEPTKEGATFVIRLPKSQRNAEIAT
jgi:signal transduction histidine kinase